VTAPLVSVIMASYNGASYIAESIDSVLAQTYEPIELIVVDDASSDGTAELVAAYAEREPTRVRAQLKRTRTGPCRARNDALSMARGPLIAWLDHDDLWLPTKVEEQVAVLEARPDVGLVYTYFDAFDSDTGSLIPWPEGRSDAEGDVLADLLLIGCFIGSCTAMFRREALDRRGGRLRDRDFSIGDDYQLWLTIALDWRVARIPKVMARYRRHRSNESSRVAGAIDVRSWRTAFLQEFIAQFPEAVSRLGRQPRVALAGQLLRSGMSRLRARDPAQAWRAAMTGVRILAAVRPLAGQGSEETPGTDKERFAA
jgi:glycosyltransferase involved in cell wall biosynthesis